MSEWEQMVFGYNVLFFFLLLNMKIHWYIHSNVTYSLKKKGQKQSPGSFQTRLWDLHDCDYFIVWTLVLWDLVKYLFKLHHAETALRLVIGLKQTPSELFDLNPSFDVIYVLLFHFLKNMFRTSRGWEGIVLILPIKKKLLSLHQWFSIFRPILFNLWLSNFSAFCTNL